MYVEDLCGMKLRENNKFFLTNNIRCNRLKVEIKIY